MAGVFLSILGIKLIFMSWIFVFKFYYNVLALFADKFPADQISRNEISKISLKYG